MLKKNKRNNKEEKSRHIPIKLDITSLYSRNYNAKYGIREIARKLNINHQTALNHLNLLVKNNTLSYERRGRNKEFSLNIDNINTKLLVDAAEGYKSYSRECLIDFVRDRFASKFTGMQIELIDQLRVMRNDIAYRGAFIEDDFLERNEFRLNGFVNNSISFIFHLELPPCVLGTRKSPHLFFFWQENSFIKNE